MRLLIVAEYVRRFPWSAARWSADLARALQRRGHEVTVACDGVEDPGFFGTVPLVVRRPLRTFRGADPLGFQAWATRMRRDAEATISLTPWVPAELWAPVVHSSAALARHLVRSHSLISAAMELGARSWLPLGMLAESRARANAGPQARPARLGALSGPRPLGYASRLERPDGDTRQESRDAVRVLLGLAPHRPAILVSAVHPYRPGFEPFIRGFALACDELADHAPALLIMGRRVIGAQQAAIRAGCARHVRFLGATYRPGLAFAATDLAAAPWSGEGEITTGRFVSDALRLAVPVLVHPRAPGAELVEPAHFGTPEVGAIVAPTAEAWHRVIVEYLSRERLPYAARAAHDAGAVLSLDGLAARVERALGA